MVVDNGDGRCTAARTFRAYQNRSDLFGDAIVDFLFQIAEQRLGREAGNGDVTRFISRMGEGASGGEMVSHLSRRLH